MVARLVHVQLWAWTAWKAIVDGRRRDAIAVPKPPELSLLALLSERPVSDIVAIVLTQPEWSPGEPVNIRQCAVIQSAAKKSRVNVFALTAAALSAVRATARDAVAFAKSQYGDEHAFDVEYWVNIFDDDYGALRDVDGALYVRPVNAGYSAGT
jgi:hypothetical protein